MSEYCRRSSVFSGIHVTKLLRVAEFGQKHLNGRDRLGKVTEVIYSGISFLARHSRVPSPHRVDAS